MKRYNVLWIDDDHEDFEDFKFTAQSEKINLIAFKSFNSAFEYLNNNLDFIDGILLDAMFFMHESQEKGTEDLKGFREADKHLTKLESIKYLPRFILSGQTRFDHDSTFKDVYGDYYRKTNPKDIERLFSDIRRSADNLPDAQLKQKYYSLLEICTNNYIGDKHFSRLFTLIKHVENIEHERNTEDMLNPLRKILESIFTRLGEIGILPESILKSAGRLNKSSLFLSNKHEDYIHLEEFIHPMIGESIFRLLNITQDGSHGDGVLKLRADEYLKTSNNDYLYKSCVYLLFDILLWFKSFRDDYPKPEENLKLWKRKDEGEWVAGVVLKIAENGFGDFQPDDGTGLITLTPEKIKEHDLKTGDCIEVKTYLYGIKKKIHISSINKL